MSELLAEAAQHIGLVARLDALRTGNHWTVALPGAGRGDGPTLEEAARRFVTTLLSTLNTQEQQLTRLRNEQAQLCVALRSFLALPVAHHRGCATHVIDQVRCTCGLDDAVVAARQVLAGVTA